MHFNVVNWLRTVTVRLRSRAGREKGAEYKKKLKPQDMDTGVQRLCLLIPVEEYAELPVEKEEEAQ